MSEEDTIGTLRIQNDMQATKIAALEKQRDELLAACKRARRDFDQKPGVLRTMTRRNLDTVIADVEGVGDE